MVLEVGLVAFVVLAGVAGGLLAHKAVQTLREPNDGLRQSKLEKDVAERDSLANEALYKVAPELAVELGYIEPPPPDLSYGTKGALSQCDLLDMINPAVTVLGISDQQLEPNKWYSAQQLKAMASATPSHFQSALQNQSLRDRYYGHLSGLGASSNGLGNRPFKSETVGSNPPAPIVGIKVDYDACHNMYVFRLGKEVLSIPQELATPERVKETLGDLMWAHEDQAAALLPSGRTRKEFDGTRTPVAQQGAEDN